MSLVGLLEAWLEIGFHMEVQGNALWRNLSGSEGSKRGKEVSKVCSFRWGLAPACSHSAEELWSRNYTLSLAHLAARGLGFWASVSVSHWIPIAENEVGRGETWTIAQGQSFGDFSNKTDIHWGMDTLNLVKGIPVDPRKAPTARLLHCGNPWHWYHLLKQEKFPYPLCRACDGGMAHFVGAPLLIPPGGACKRSGCGECWPHSSI